LGDFEVVEPYAIAWVKETGAQVYWRGCSARVGGLAVGSADECSQHQALRKHLTSPSQFLIPYLEQTL
jgi:hypothetical protein